MIRLLLLCFVVLSTTAWSAIDITFSVKSPGYAYRGSTTTNKTTVFQIVATEDGTGSDTLEKLIFEVTGLNEFGTSAEIIDVDVLLDDATIVESTDITTSTSSITLTLNESFTTAQTKTYDVALTLANSAQLTSTSSMQVTGNSTAGQLDGDVTVARTFKVTGVDVDVVPNNKEFIIFDADAEKFLMLDFTISPLADDPYLLDEIVISNGGDVEFDVDGTENGVTNLYLYKDSNVNGVYDDGIDSFVKSLVTNDNSNVTNNTATFVFNSNDGSSIRQVGPTSQRYLLLYDIGANTGIQSDDDDLLNVRAQITSISGSGSDSDLSYTPINIDVNTNNNVLIEIAGMVIESIENIFPSINVSSDLTDIPILKFKATSVGISSLLSKLVITNDSNIFSTTSAPSGLSKLTWFKDNGNETFDGIDFETEVDSITLDSANDLDANGTDSNTATDATIVQNVTANVIATGNSQTYYILADFGSNMSSGQTVSLNISRDTRASYDQDNNDDYTDDVSTVNYNDLNIGSALPLLVTPTQSITLIDPILKVDTLVDQILYNDSDSGSLNIVAGMYNVEFYNFTIDVDDQITNATFEFESPNGFFSAESTGILKLSLYLDQDSSGTLTEGDIFLSSVSEFTDSDRIARVQNVNIPKGKDQKLLVVIDLGQRVTDLSDQLSIQFNGVTLETGDVAGLFPNPITPYTFDTKGHLMEISDISTTGIASSNVISEDSEFRVSIEVAPSTVIGSHDIQLLGVLTPSSNPKFYLDGVSGKDRSYEFESSFNASLSTSAFLSAFDAGTRRLVYDIDAENITSEGNYLIDADIYYQIVNDITSPEFLDNDIVITRSKGIGTNFKSAAELFSATETDIKPSIVTTNDTFSWTLPAYVSSVEVQVNNEFVTFRNYQSIPQNAQLRITFEDNGENIEPSSLSIMLNGVTVPSESSISSGSAENYFEYETTTGVLTINSIGDTSGQLTLSANDRFGEAYPDAPFIFYTSASLQIDKFLIFPNPFSPTITTTGVTIGFSITQPATVRIQVYNSMGREVSKLSKTAFPMGYNSISWDAVIDATGKYISSGTYFLKLTAESADGDEVTETTKLAVY